MTTYKEMTGPQMVEAHNQRVEQAAKVEGLAGKYQPVKKFRTKEAGIKKLEALDRALATAAKAQAKAQAKADGKARDGAAAKPERTTPTIRELTEEFNALVPEATKLGIKAKVHTSAFGSIDGGQKQLERLRASIVAAQQTAAA